MTQKHVIDKIYLFVANNPEGEGILAARYHDIFLPFIASDKERVHSLFERAKEMSKSSGRRVSIK